MSKKHFIAIAAAIKRQLDAKFHDPCFGEGYRAGIVGTARDFARIAAESNPNFNAVRFYTACGLND